MGKEADSGVDLELGRKLAFDKMANFGIASIVCTAATYAHPLFAIPAIGFYVGFVRHFKNYENLCRKS